MGIFFLSVQGIRFISNQQSLSRSLLGRVPVRSFCFFHSSPRSATAGISSVTSLRHRSLFLFDKCFLTGRILTSPPVITTVSFVESEVKIDQLASRMCHFLAFSSFCVARLYFRVTSLRQKTPPPQTQPPPRGCCKQPPTKQKKTKKKTPPPNRFPFRDDPSPGQKVSTLFFLQRPDPSFWHVSCR